MCRVICLTAAAAGLVRARPEGSEAEKRRGVLTGCECVGASLLHHC